MTKDLAPKETHRILGGSVMGIATHCTGSVFLSKDLPNVTSKDSQQGTEFHSWCAEYASAFLDFQTDGVTEYLPVVAGAPDEMLEFIAQYTDILWHKILNESLDRKAYGFEEEVILDDKLEMGGTADFYAIYTDDKGRKVLCIGDIKYGYHFVTVENNPQLIFYACALREFFVKNGKDVDIVRTFIFQPRCPEGESFREAFYTVKQIEKWRSKFFKIADEIFVKQKPKFKVGEWCKFCKGKPLCTVFSKTQETEMGLKLIDVKEIKLPQPETLSKEQITKIILNSESLEGFIKSCKSYALSQIQIGNTFPELKIVNGKGKRVWIEDEKVITYELENVLETEKIFKQKLLPLTAVEKSLDIALGKKDGPKLMKKLTKKTAPIKLVSIDDPRAAIPNTTDLLTLIED